jgi:hypothetical protein
MKDIQTLRLTNGQETGQTDSHRYQIGTVRDGNFLGDTIGSDPELTSFPTLELALEEMAEVIRQSAAMWGEPMTNGAIYDNHTGYVVWRQDADQGNQ